MKSILQNKKRCYICRKEVGIHDHHIYFGKAKRPISERHGFKVWLCQEHHQGSFGVHGMKGHELGLFLKKICQQMYERNHTRADFMKIIGRNYLEEEENQL